MANTSIPEWAPFAAIGGVVLLLVLSKSGGGGGGAMVGSVTTLAPLPADPGVLSLMSAEVSAREHGFDSIVNLFGTRVQSDRDVTISRINADIQNQRTAAQLNASNYAESVRHDVGIAATNAGVAIERARADASVRITDSQGATAKYVAKKSNNPLNTFIKGAASVVSSIFGKH